MTTNSNPTVGERLQNAVARALRESADREDEARQVAGHIEESGEVCVPDCLACNDPVRAVIRDLREARSEAFQRGRSIAELERERDALRAALKRMTEVFYPHPRADTEGWREEQEAYDGALITLGVKIP
jgi:hypothetical protein